MQKQKLAALCLACLTLTLSSVHKELSAAQMVAPLSLAQIKAESLKSLFRREPEAQDLLGKTEAKISEWLGDSYAAPYVARLENELLRIEMYAAGETEARLKSDIELLTAASAATKPPALADLAPLQQRYKKLVDDLSDAILVKDFDRLLKRHDRFIRHTSLGLWDKDKIAAELLKMEEMLADAPDIAYGKSESLAGLQDRRLASVNNLVYVGTFPHEEAYLSTDRRSVGIIQESLGGSIPIETADLVIQSADGALVDLNTSNNPALGLPFAPSIGLWMKSRMLDGKVPAITFKLAENSSGKQLCIQDVLDGKLDDYFKRNIKAISDTKEAAIVGIFDQFDGELAQNSFGADGKTPFYMFDPKLAKLSGRDAKQEYLKRAEKGNYANPKSITLELSNHYGDPSVPDGPERVRDAWKHLRELVTKTGPNIAYYSTAGAYHGSKIAFKSPDLATSGTQAWNKLDYYFPGNGVLDWIGTEATGAAPAVDPKGPNMVDAIDSFFQEAKNSQWQQTPVMLRGAAPEVTAHPTTETPWITATFQQLIKNNYPSTSIVFVELPARLTLWSRDAASAYRTAVTSDKFYKWPLRFKMLGQKD